MHLFVIFLTGALFSAGLMVSGMINPAKVIGFLDIFGVWDPSLAFVMAFAVIVYGIGLRLVLRRPKPLFEARFFLPEGLLIDRRLVGGAILFGIGWGLVGFCPGPAIAALGAAPGQAAIFVAAMLLATSATRKLQRS
ncbi:DUF6691 family protein [Marinobacterium sedimentorum]|uniref:DUF6691 family protein n=1 Tax=Marinobacterium sedimentorum TaxID=2927804 RepID=UPI0020C5C30D|nr:DUF6691 family protein [Marinobacterium sedimentorum]MCP8688108.1 YeeE/YedE family protein [Marinobacterium sedimentorum]